MTKCTCKKILSAATMLLQCSVFPKSLPFLAFSELKGYREINPKSLHKNIWKLNTLVNQRRVFSKYLASAACRAASWQHEKEQQVIVKSYLILELVFTTPPASACPAHADTHKHKGIIPSFVLSNSVVDFSLLAPWPLFSAASLMCCFSHNNRCTHVPTRIMHAPDLHNSLVAPGTSSNDLNWKAMAFPPLITTCRSSLGWWLSSISHPLFVFCFVNLSAQQIINQSKKELALWWCLSAS